MGNHSDAGDKNDNPSRDNNVIQKENNYKLKNNNNEKFNSITSENNKDEMLLSTLEFKKDIKQKIKILIKRKEILTQKLNRSNHSKDVTYELLRQIGIVEDQIQFLTDTQQQEFKKREHDTKKLKQQSELVENPYYVATLQGEREIKQNMIIKTIQELSNLGYPQKEANRLTNELIFETRFGSLRQSKLQGKGLTVQHALHIGLKLIREKRWSTPTHFQNYVLS